MKIKTLDILLITFLVILSIYPLFNKKSGNKQLYLLVGDKRIRLPFKNKIINLKDSFNKNVIIEVKGNKARIKESDCKLQICVKTGWISQCNDLAVCIPNKVALMIVCTESNFDAISK